MIAWYWLKDEPNMTEEYIKYEKDHESKTCINIFDTS